MKVVKEFFKGDKYAGNRKAIAKYAQWATRDNGPGIFGDPAPIDCIIMKGKPGYMVGFFSVRFSSQTNVFLFRRAKISSDQSLSLMFSRLSSSVVRTRAKITVDLWALLQWQPQR